MTPARTIESYFHVRRVSVVDETLDDRRPVEPPSTGLLRVYIVRHGPVEASGWYDSDMHGGMSAEEASAITVQIRTNASDLSQLMKQARDGQAWRALGYQNFEEWVRESFGWSRARAYQLINIATLNDELREMVTLPEDWALSDLQTRRIHHFGTEVVLGMLQAEKTDRPDENARLLTTILARLTREESGRQETAAAPDERPASNIQAMPSMIANGQRNTQTALVMANSLLQQARQFPSTTGLSVITVRHVVATLETAATEATRRLEEFNAAIAGSAEADGVIGA